MEEDTNRANALKATITPISVSDIPNSLAKIAKYVQEAITAPKVKNLIRLGFTSETKENQNDL